MARMISSKASLESIVATMATTIHVASTLGGDIERGCVSLVHPAFTLAQEALAARERALAEQAAARERVTLRERAVHLVVGACHDRLWNELGRPSNDLRMAVLFPDGVKTCADVPLAQRGQALRDLATLIAQAPFQRLRPGLTDAIAHDLRAVAGPLTADTAALADADLLVRRTYRAGHALARLGQAALMNYKRALLNLGLRDTEVFRIIPPAKRPAAPPFLAAPAAAEMEREASPSIQAREASPSTQPPAAAAPDFEDLAPEVGVDPNSAVVSDEDEAWALSAIRAA